MRHPYSANVVRTVFAGLLATGFIQAAHAQQFNYMGPLKQAESAAAGLPLGAARSPETDEIFRKSQRQLEALGTQRMFVGDQQGALLAQDAVLRQWKEGPVTAEELRLLAKSGSKEPFVLKAKDGSNVVTLGLAGRVDMLVVFPRYGTVDGRPEWLQTLAGRKPREIPADLLPKSGRRLIKAHRVGAPDDAVPADVVLVEAGKPVPKLMLPDGGEYRYSFED